MSWVFVFLPSLAISGIFYWLMRLGLKRDGSHRHSRREAAMVAAMVGLVFAAVAVLKIWSGADYNSDERDSDPSYRGMDL
jgi:hypothetical protein